MLCKNPSGGFRCCRCIICRTRCIYRIHKRTDFFCPCALLRIPLLSPTAFPSSLSAVTHAHPPLPTPDLTHSYTPSASSQCLVIFVAHHQAELRRAKELQGHTDLEALSRESSPFQAALRQKHLSQLRSPKGGFSGYKDWADDDAKSDMMSRASFTSTSTLPPSPPPARSPPRSALPPRCPPRGGVSRRSRQPCAVRERVNNAGFASACPPAAEGLVG